MDSQKILFNGLHASGRYLKKPMTPSELSSVILGQDKSHESKDPHVEELKSVTKGKSAVYLAHAEGLDPRNLASVGWGVIFPEHQNTASIREALSPLLEHRKAQAASYYRELELLKGENKQGFFNRYKVGIGPTNPEKMPYYLLIVGDPEAIPYRFQYELDVQYAVGRIYFENSEEYATYAQSVVEAEKRGISRARRAVFFGVQAHDDLATQSSATNLVTPLEKLVAEDQSEKGWKTELWLKDQAYKSHLTGLLGGNRTPAFLLAASHGMGFDLGDTRLLSHQGSLVCQDWPGPDNWQRDIPEKFYFSKDDVSSEARLLGLIAFFFACYGGGTPQFDSFGKAGERQTIAPYPFVAGLPQRLLGHPNGGALAAIGHVDRTWSTSFQSPEGSENGQRHIEVFQSALKRLFDGYPVGAAMEYFNNYYAELSTQLTLRIDDINNQKPFDEWELSLNWLMNHDARNYTIIGDPAVRLMVADKDKKASAPDDLELAQIVHFVDSDTDDVSNRDDATDTDIIEYKKENPEEQKQEPAAPGSAAEAGYDFGLLSKEREMLAKSWQDLIDNLSEKLRESIVSATTLEIKTYTSDDKPIPELDADKPLSEAGTLSAVTRIGLDGDMETLFRREKDKFDKDLISLHEKNVEKALSQRRLLLESILKLVGDSLGSLVPK